VTSASLLTCFTTIVIVFDHGYQVRFADVLCQMTDMIKPKQQGAIVLSDLLR
jgi:hypothetical protein